MFWASGRNSGVECKLPKLDVASSNLVARSKGKEKEIISKGS